MNIIVAALMSLNVDDDSQWTEDGLPVLELIRNMTGMQDLTREQIVNDAPGFTREMYREHLKAEASNSQTPVVPVTNSSEIDPEDANQAAENVAPVTTPPVSTEVQTPVAPPVEPPTPVVTPAVKVDPAQRLAIVQRARADIETRISKLTIERDKHVVEEDKLIEQMSSKISNQQASHDMQDYLAAQRKILSDRADKMRAIRAAGGDVKLQSPIDVAARNRPRPTRV